MAYKKKELVVEYHPRYMVTDTITGNINNKIINAKRGDVVKLTADEVRVFQGKILIIPKEE